jgi:hypothetical protein
MSHQQRSVRRLVGRACVGAIAAGGLVSVAALPASASARPQAHSRAVHAPFGITADVSHVKNSATASTYLAGYTATPGALVSAGVTFKVPKFTCAATGVYGNMFGVGDEATFGDPTTLAAVWQVCENGTAYNYLDVQANASLFTETGFSPGDTIVASFFQTATLDQATIHDITSTYSYVAQGAPVPDASATFGTFPLFDDGSQIPIPKFSKVSMSQATVNGDYLSYAAPTQLNLTSGTKTLISTGTLKANSSFTLTFKASS